jgi:hypothetical protein
LTSGAGVLSRIARAAPDIADPSGTHGNRENHHPLTEEEFKFRAYAGPMCARASAYEMLALGKPTLEPQSKLLPPNFNPKNDCIGQLDRCVGQLDLAARSCAARRSNISGCRM